MIFGNPLEKSVDEISQKLEEQKNQRKLVELDLEKRILILESSITSLQKLLGNINDFEAAKDTISRIEDLQNKLRDIEDTNLITRLETVQSDDRLVVIDDDLAELKEKVSLLSDAIDLLSESKGNVSDENLKQNPKEFAAIKSELALMKDAVSKLSSNMVPPQKIIELGEDAAKVQNEMQSLRKDFSGLTGTVREKLELMERNLRQQKNVEVPERVERDILGVQKELERIKVLEAQIVKQIESDSRKIQELKGLQDERRDYNSIKASIESMQKNVAVLKKEMDLDRSMYPENLMRLEKEVSELRGARKDIAALGDVRKLAADLQLLIAEHKTIREKLPKYEETIGALIKNNDTLKSGIAETVGAVKETLSESAELKKSVAAIQKEVAGSRGIEALPALRQELAAEKEQTARMVRDIGEKVARLEALQKEPFDSFGKVEDDVRFLRREISNLKEQMSQQASGKSPKEFEEFQKTLAVLKKELDLDRAMHQAELSTYPKGKEKRGSSAAVIAGPAAWQELGSIKDTIKSLAAENDILRKELEAIKGAPVRGEVPSVSVSAGDGSVDQRIERLENALKEFRVLAESLLDNNQQLEEGLTEARLDLDEMRQRQPIIID